MFVRAAKTQMPEALVASVKGVAALVIGLALGHGLMWGAGYLGYELSERMVVQPHDERLFLGGLMLALSLAALVLTGAAMAARNPPGWLSAFFLGAAAASPLTIFALFFMLRPWGGD
jgi:hypothetical protein